MGILKIRKFTFQYCKLKDDQIYTFFVTYENQLYTFYGHTVARWNQPKSGRADSILFKRDNFMI